MSERMQNILVGFTAMLAMAGLAMLLMLFGYMPRMLEEGYRVKVDMSDATGLKADSRVRFRGIDVGRIESVALDASSKSGVIVELMIRNGINIPRGTIAVAKIPLIGRSPGLNLEVTHLSNDQLASSLSQDGTALIDGRTLTATDEMVQELSKTVDQFASRLDKVSDSFQALSNEWVIVGKNVNQMIEPRDLADVDAKKVRSNVTTLIARMDQRLTELQTSIDGVNKWINDPELRDSIKGAAANIDSFTGKLNEGVDQFNSLVGDTRTQVGTLGKKYAKVADDLSEAINTIDMFAKKAQSGKGTLGKLLTDPALYDDLDDSVQRIGKLVTELKVMVQKWQTEGLPIKVK
jgi:phospholipid/cholesterol/gamma-HCH transport system substrate-binding protein